MSETNKTILLSQPPDGKAYHHSLRMGSYSSSKHYNIHDKAKITVPYSGVNMTGRRENGLRL